MMLLSVASTFIHIRSQETVCKPTDSMCTFPRSQQSQRNEKAVSYKQSILGQYYMKHVKDFLPPKKRQTFPWLELAESATKNATPYVPSSVTAKSSQDILQARWKWQQL